MSFFFAIASAAGKYKSGGITPEPVPEPTIPIFFRPYVEEGYFLTDYSPNYYN